MSLSIAIPTYNEENNIAATINSVYDWVNEIIIVDGTSTDKTVEVIKKLDTKGKIKIFVEDNPPNFLVNKQRAIERCTKDWILQLDADEVVSEELKSEILSLPQIKNSKLKIKNYIAFWIPRLNYFLGNPLRKGGVYPDYCLRLYRNGVARIPLKGIHDQVEIKINNNFQPVSTNFNQFQQISTLNSPLLHYSYPSFSVYLKKWRKYNQYEALALKQKGFKPNSKLAVDYLIFKPVSWFFLTYFRHKGFMDGLPGLVFSIFSSLRFPMIYVILSKN